MSGSIPIKLLIVGISGEGVRGDLSVFLLCGWSFLQWAVFLSWFWKDLKCLIWYLHTRGSSSCVRVLDTESRVIMLVRYGLDVITEWKWLRKWVVRGSLHKQSCWRIVQLASKGVDDQGRCSDWGWGPSAGSDVKDLHASVSAPSVLWFHVVHQKAGFCVFLSLTAKKIFSRGLSHCLLPFISTSNFY